MQIASSEVTLSPGRKGSGAHRDFATLLRAGLNLPASVEELRRRYADAKPFPHLILDNLFAPEVLEAVVAEASENHGDSDEWLLIATDGLERVLRMRTGVDMGPASYQLAAFLHAPAFLYLLSELTGIWQLLPDPYLQGAGHAAMRRKMFMEVHSDRNTAYATGLTRRLAMIIFLNKEWRTEYAGQLELWSSDGSRCEVSIEPLFNRTVLFEVADPNYHGVPTPLNCSADQVRRSFIVYYHTVGGKDGRTPTPHTSVFAPRAYRRKASVVRSLIESATPPVLLKALKRLLGP